MSVKALKRGSKVSQIGYSRETEADIKPMDFNELFNFVNDCCREIVLWELVGELMENFQEDESFGVFLEVLAEYVWQETERESEIKVAYEVVAKLLSNAAKVARRDLPSDAIASSGIRVYYEARILKAISEYARRKLMLQIVSAWIRGLQAERYRFSQLLAVLSDHVDSKAAGEGSDRELWSIVAQILRDAAAAAEREGEEMP